MEFASRLSDLGLGDAEIETLFLQMDKDSDGVISAEEFVSGFTKYKELEHRSLTTLAAAPSLVGSSRNAERYTEMQYESDTDLVDDLEKIMAAGDLHAEQQKAVDEAFAAADTDGSGSISEAEFGKVLAGLGVAMGGDELAHVLQAHFAKLDSDYSGELDLPEFGNFYRRCLATAELRRKYAKKARKHSLKLQKQVCASACVCLRGVCPQPSSFVGPLWPSRSTRHTRGGSSSSSTRTALARSRSRSCRRWCSSCCRTSLSSPRSGWTSRSQCSSQGTRTATRRWILRSFLTST
jgi:Ca2+-binding EF-hand superfamily protein